MPRHHQPPSLKTASLLNIAQHIDSYWCSETNAKILETPRLLYIIGPFDYLSDDLLQQLLVTLARCKTLRRYHLQLIIHCNVRVLDLSNCQAAANHPSVINTIGQRCQKLTHLKLSKLRQINATVLCNLMSNLPALKALDLSGTKCNGSVLQAIAHNNLLLADLDVARCPIREDELLFLCNCSRSPSSSIDLRKLSVEGINVSTKTVASLLRCHRNLNNLNGTTSVCAALQDICGETFQSRFPVSQEYCFKLTQVVISFQGFRPSGGLVTKRYVELLVACCPFLTKLVFFGAEDDGALSPLSELQHLNSIEIYSDYGDITFQNGIVPLLKNIGQNLRTVSLHFVKSTDLPSIGALCPNICNLDISLNMAGTGIAAGEPTATWEREFREEVPPGCFAKLEKFDLLVCSETLPLSDKTIAVVLNSASSLRHLKLTNVHTVTDNTISKALETHGFKHLEEVDLENCGSVTARTGWMFLDAEGPLLRLFVPNCRAITLADWESYRKYCTDNNLDVDVFWT